MDLPWVWIILAVVVALLLMWLVGTYNRLVNQRELVENSMGQVAAQVESRWDALTSLISAAKQYAAHEADALEAVTARRTRITPASSVSQVAADDHDFAGALARFTAVAEAYPQLRASETYRDAMNGVNAFENNVRHSRMIYNDSVTKLNRDVKQFPTSIAAALFGFRPRDYFQATAAKSDMPSW